MPAPTFIGEGETAFNSATTPKAAAVSGSPAAGDVLVAGQVIEDQSTSGAISGGGLTWTERQQVNVADYTRVYGWTATAAGAITPSFSRPAGSGWFGGDTVAFRDSDGIGATAKRNGNSGDATVDITTTQDNSAVVLFIGDWVAADGTGRDWLPVNGADPVELVYFRNSTHYAAYAAYYADVGAAGAKTVGLDLPAGMKFSIVATEVKGRAGGGTEYNDAPSGGATAGGTLTNTHDLANGPTGGATASGQTGEAHQRASAPTAGPSAGGALLEGLSFPDQPIGGPTPQGAAAESHTRASTPTGGPTAQGTPGETHQRSTSPSAGPIAAGTIVESHVHGSTSTGNPTVSGSIVESWQQDGAYDDQPTGGPVAGGTLIESHIRSSAPTGAVTGGGTLADALTHTGSPLGPVQALGQLVDQLTHGDSPAGGATAAGALARSTTFDEQLVGGPVVNGSNESGVVEPVTWETQPHGWAAPTSAGRLNYAGTGRVSGPSTGRVS